MEKSNIDNAKLVMRLQKPKGKVDVVIDTDTYNEIDDQFAVAYLIKSDEKLNLKAIYQLRSTMKNPLVLQMVWKKAIRKL